MTSIARSRCRTSRSFLGSCATAILEAQHHSPNAIFSAFIYLICTSRLLLTDIIARLRTKSLQYSARTGPVDTTLAAWISTRICPRPLEKYKLKIRSRPPSHAHHHEIHHRQPYVIQPGSFTFSNLEVLNDSRSASTSELVTEIPISEDYT
jgi:hypothetical protein